MMSASDHLSGDQFSTPKKLTADHFWNETYTSGMSGETESAVHSAFEELAKNPPKWANNCGEVCSRVHSHLLTHGINAKVVSGDFTAGYGKGAPLPSSREHVWLEVDNHVIDPTAGQFRDQFKGPYKKTHYQKG